MKHAVQPSSGQCLTGWTAVGSQCYQCYTSITTVPPATDYCQGIGGDLASLHSATQESWILANCGSKVLIGYDSGQEAWQDGSSTAYVQSAKGSWNQYCRYVKGNGWFTYPCTDSGGDVTAACSYDPGSKLPMPAPPQPGKSTTSPVPISCGDPGTPARAHGVLTGVYEDDTSTVTCHTGYALASGDLIRTCKSTGDWSGNQPVCNLLTCSNPPPLYPNTDAIYTLVTYQSTVTYNCAYKYKMTGRFFSSATLTCDAQGLWSGFPPSCIAITCTDPGTIVFAQRVLTGLQVEDSVTYTCSAGTTYVSGDLVRTCKVTETWNGTSPVCDPITSTAVSTTTSTTTSSTTSPTTSPTRSTTILPTTSTTALHTMSITTTPAKSTTLPAASATASPKTSIETSAATSPTTTTKPQESTTATSTTPSPIPSITASSKTTSATVTSTTLPKESTMRSTLTTPKTSPTAKTLSITTMPRAPQATTKQKTITQITLDHPGMTTALATKDTSNPKIEIKTTTTVNILFTRTYATVKSVSAGTTTFQEITCYIPHTTLFLHAEYNSTKVNSTVRYFCSRGYFMSKGDSHQRCYSNGSWSGEVPVCRGVKDVMLTDVGELIRARNPVESPGGPALGSMSLIVVVIVVAFVVLADVPHVLRDAKRGFARLKKALARKCKRHRQGYISSTLTVENLVYHTCTDSINCTCNSRYRADGIDSDFDHLFYDETMVTQVKMRRIFTA